MKKSEQTTFVFQEFNCAQTVFSLFAPDLELNTTAAMRIASGFGSGMNCGETCGAVTGAYMVIGLKSGHDTSNPEDKAHTKEMILKFNKLFLSEHPSLKCKELLGYDVSVPEQKENARQSGVFDSHCPCYLKTAAKILEDYF